jgi:hypothetical protein
MIPFRYTDSSNTFANHMTIKVGVIAFSDGSQVMIEVGSNDHVRIAKRDDDRSSWGSWSSGQVAPA